MKRLIASILMLSGGLLSLCAQNTTPQWSVKLKKNEVVVNEGKASFQFSGQFTVWFTTDNPKMELRNLTDCKYFAPSWEAKGLPADKMIAKIKKSEATGGDGIDESMSGSTRNRTFDVFYTAPQTVFSPVKAVQKGDTICFEYEPQAVGTLSARVFMPRNEAPVLEYRFVPSRQGWYSVAYTGAPSLAVEALEALWQPMIWQRKIFPAQSYLTLAFNCPVPATLLQKKEGSVGVVVATEEFPFQPLPTRDNNRFGVALRDKEGKARPMVFAPVLGHVGSEMKAGDEFRFKLHLWVEANTLQNTYETIARQMFGFQDYRTNAISTLNNAIDNIIDYTLSPYSNFIDSLKGCSYSTDVPGSVKNVSSLNPLSVALLADDEEVYSKRAYPILEYMLSREKTLFCLDTTQKVQSPSRKMGGPCATISELAMLYKLSGKKSAFLKQMTENKFYKGKPLEKRVKGVGGNWYDALEIYRATGEKEYLDRAILGADSYLNNYIYRQPDKFQNAFFWSSYAPKYVNLLELYEETGEKRFLEAAHFAAREYAMFVWMCPRIPDSTVLVNQGGWAPHYWYLKSRGIPRQKAEEELVPAWRLSEMGLVSESATTGIGHRAVFMAHHAPYMMRIAGYTGDRFLYDIARSAIVGRYANFPGYHINTERTTAYEKPDFPLRSHQEMSVNSFHYNHPFPLLSVLYDFAITDVKEHSGGKISFPGDYIEGYGYLQARFYGGRPGTFYDYASAWLWMPRRLLVTGSVELNYIAARTDQHLLVAFTNQSGGKVNSSVAFNLNLLPQLSGRKYQVEIWEENRKTGEAQLVDGKINIQVAAKGITALVVKNVNVKPHFQGRMENTAGSVWKHDYVETAFGHASLMIINMGEGLKTAFLYLRDDDSVYSQVTLAYKLDNGRFQTITDHAYPYEFTVPLSAENKELYIQLTGVDREGRIQKSEIFKMGAQ